MNWKTKFKILEPHEGDEKDFRYKTIFSWRIRKTEDGKTVWLERVLIKEQSIDIRYFDSYSPYYSDIRSEWQEVESWSKGSTTWGERL